MIERHIVTGMILSTEYLQQIRTLWDSSLMESKSARLISDWCWEYFERYDHAPGKDIEGIFFQKVESGLNSETAEDIETILQSLDRNQRKDKFNLGYLMDETLKHFRDRKLELHMEQIRALLSRGELDQAEGLACNYKILSSESDTDMDLGKLEALKRVESAFVTTSQPVVSYPRQLGDFWNLQFVRGGLVALMAPEKRGKTFWLLDIAIRGCLQKAKVAFFQAGDMTESQQLKRICVYLTRTSDLEKYCGHRWEPVRDCYRNQLGKCNHPDRECDFGVFEGMSIKDLKGVTLEEMIEKHREFPEYKPCFNCKEYWNRPYGAPWIKEVEVDGPLTIRQAKRAIYKFFIKYPHSFKLSSHANGTLTLSRIKAILSRWEKTDGFTPDLIVIDYADLLVPEVKTEFRHQQNEIWKGLRSLSQERHCLVVTATQADADSYERNRLRMKNFSEDKRKYAHVTAMYGLNQDPQDREKKIGLMRINEIVVREGDFSNTKEVTVIQNLARGRPFLGSYYNFADEK